MSDDAPPALPATAWATSCAVEPSTHLVKGTLRFYHYGVDNFRDHGWGCGYRSIQSILSWLKPSELPPSIPELQGMLPGIDGAQAWVGVPDAVVLLDVLHNATTRVLPLASGADLEKHLPTVAAHFDNGGGPLMIGGGGDVYSKTVIGVRVGGSGASSSLLILDPHYSGPTAGGPKASIEELHAAGWAAWKPLSCLSARSFYNIALPRALDPNAAAAATACVREVAGRGGVAEEQSWDFEIVEEGEG